MGWNGNNSRVGEELKFAELMECPGFAPSMIAWCDGSCQMAIIEGGAFNFWNIRKLCFLPQNLILPGSGAGVGPSISCWIQPQPAWLVAMDDEGCSLAYPPTFPWWKEGCPLATSRALQVPPGSIPSPCFSSSSLSPTGLEAESLRSCV